MDRPLGLGEAEAPGGRAGKIPSEKAVVSLVMGSVHRFVPSPMGYKLSGGESFSVPCHFFWCGFRFVHAKGSKEQNKHKSIDVEMLLCLCQPQSKAYVLLS